LNFEEVESRQLHSNDNAANWKVNRNQNEEQKNDTYDKINMDNSQKQVKSTRSSKSKMNGDFQKNVPQKRKKRKETVNKKERLHSEIEQINKENMMRENLTTIEKSS
jgi:hypothetical protein